MAKAELNLAGFTPYRLSVTSNAVSDLIAREYQSRFGLKIPEWRVMAVMGQGNAQTQRDLVHATHMDKVTVNRATKALVDRRLLSRTPSEKDGRSHHLELSEAGWQLYNEISPAALAMEAKILSVLNDDERATLLALLDKVQAAAEYAAERL